MLKYIHIVIVGALDILAYLFTFFVFDFSNKTRLLILISVLAVSFLLLLVCCYHSYSKLKMKLKAIEDNRKSLTILYKQEQEYNEKLECFAKRTISQIDFACLTYKEAKFQTLRENVCREYYIIKKGVKVNESYKDTERYSNIN